MPTIQDKEFGKITIRRSAKATQVRIKVAPDGTLRASAPIYAPLFLVKRLLNNSRDEIKKILNQSKPIYSYKNGMQVGKSHTLIIQKTDSKKLEVTTHGQQIIVRLPFNVNIYDKEVSQKIREAFISALKLEAKSYLPRRLSFLAQKYGFVYSRLRFSHASSRWGSCSSSGTISLNIALMKLPFEIIDYVIIHELSHTVQMNHSSKFWEVVSTADPNYKSHRHFLKTQNPSI